MRVLVVHASGSPIRDIRQAVLGAGGECHAEDCVSPQDLAARLAQVPVNLVVVKTEPAGLDVARVRDALQIVAAPMVAIGNDAGAERAVAQQIGASEFIPEASARAGLETVINRLLNQSEAMSQSTSASVRGSVISVFAPLPGSGGTTVACNLAGAFAAAHPKQVALVEVAREFGDLALLLNVSPAYSARDACMRWQSLDRLSLANGFESHASGADVLVNGVEQSANEHVSRDSVRRLAVLSRFLYKYTIFALESRLGEEEREVMKLSDRILIVIRPDVVSVRRARWALDVLEQQGLGQDRTQLVVNRWGPPGKLSLQQIETTLGRKAIEQIPDDPSRVNQATNQGVLLQQYARRASISRKFDSLASKLNGLVK